MRAPGLTEAGTAGIPDLVTKLMQPVEEVAAITMASRIMVKPG